MNWVLPPQADRFRRPLHAGVVSSAARTCAAFHAARRVSMLRISD
jgi:hypothetical protein